MFRWCTIASLSLFSLQTAGAQPATSFQGPLTGFVYSLSSRNIRPLLGITGAARIGSPLLNEVDFASVGPDGKWALVTTAGRSFFMQGLSSLNPADIPAEGLLDGVDRVLWNRDGAVALLYSSSVNRLQRVRLSSSGAEVAEALDLS